MDFEKDSNDCSKKAQYLGSERQPGVVGIGTRISAKAFNDAQSR